MITKKVARKMEPLYQNVDEFRDFYPELELVSDWRSADEGDWVLSDDMQVCKILRRGTFKTASGNKVDYVRTVLGTHTVSKNSDMSGIPPKNIYSFSNKKFCNKLREERKDATPTEFVFAKYIAKGMSPVDAYLRAFPTKKRLYAKNAASALMKTERIQKLVTEEIEEILSDIGASKKYLLEMTKVVIDNLDGKDSDKLRAIELLMKIAGMFPNDKKTESLTVFQGFDEEQLKRINAGKVQMIAHAEKQIEDKSDVK